MKKYFRETWYMYAISFVFCFMLFLYEPLQLYLNNVADFYFGINVMFKMSFLLFLLIFIPMIIVFNIIYFLNRDNNKKFFKICAIILTIVFICTYIQGNYLVGNLPVLGGEKIIWSDYKTDWIISIILWIVVIGIVILITRKVSITKMVNYSGYVSILIFFMLSVSFTTTYFTSSEPKNRDFAPLVTYKNIMKYSENNNFIILLLDSIDSTSFMNRINNDDNFNDMLNDFTYYQDAMCSHLYTLESIPLILTGKYYKNDEPISSWSTEAYKDSYLFNLMEENNFELDVYSNELLYYDESASRISNVSNLYSNNSSIRKIKFWKNEIKYILFRYLPAYLKKYSKVEEMHFTAFYISSYKGLDDRPFNYNNYEFLKINGSNKIKVVDDNIFKFFHLKGAHSPYMYDKNFNVKKDSTYLDEVDGSITLVNNYLKMLKENNVYDNSSIIIMADHGVQTKENNSQRQNPILFVKGRNETHKKMVTSSKPVHYTDLDGLYKDLISGKKTNELFANVSNNRKRRFLYYTFSNKDNMIEYETTGKVLDKDKIYKTGKEYHKTW